MKHLYSYLIFIALIISACIRPEPFHEIVPDPEWKFLPGDDLSRADPGADSGQWKSINVNERWDDQGYKDLDGFAWYRTHFLLSKSLKKDAILKDSLQIVLGKIDDYDQVFLNGQLLGVNGRTLPPGSKPDNKFIQENSIWYLPRTYKLAVNDPRLLWGKQNIIAIRVYDSGGPGGMYGGGIRIKMLDIDDYVKGEYGPEKYILKQKQIVKPFTLKNNSTKYDIQGRCDVRVSKQLSGDVILVKEWPVKLKPGEEKEFQITLPMLQEPATVECFYLHDNSSLKVAFRDEVPYILTQIGRAHV